MEKHAPLLRCEVVGQTTISIGDVRLTSEGDLVFALVLYLGLHAGEELPRDHVAQLLWPSHEAESARHSLRQLIYRVRALGVIVATHGDVLEIALESVAVDFAPLLTPEPSREIYLGFARFDVLADYAPTFSAPFARWVEDFRERVGLKLRNGLIACIADARARGRYRDVSQLARHCLSLDPLNEEATLGLAESTALAGNKIGALRMLDVYQSDVGATPGLRLQTDLLRRRISERLNVYSAQPHDVEMLGRDDAMEYLLRGVHALSDGVARSLLVTGEAGVGKTRLLTEFAKVAAMHNVRTVVLRCHPGWREQPLTAITDLVTTLLQLPGALGASPDAMAALRELTSSLPRRSDVGMYAGDAEAMLANLRWSVLDLFEAVMQEKRLVLLLDNVQWLDELSEHFLDYVLGRCSKRPLYVVMTSRGGADAEEREGKRPLLATEHQLALRPLDDATARALVRQVVELTDRDLSEASVDSCVRRCGGNPYFLSELARFYLVSGPDAVPPVTLRTFIEFRLGKVSRSARRALEVVAILGSFATLKRVRRVLGLRGFVLLDAMESLQKAWLVDLRDDACDLRHDIVREVLESAMSPIACRILHLRAARTFRNESKHSGDLVCLAERGLHLLRSGDTLRAPKGALLLARRLLRLGAAEKAAELASMARLRTVDPEHQALALGLEIAARRLLGNWAAVASLKIAYRRCRAPEPDFTSATDLQLLESDLALAPATHEFAAEVLPRANSVRTPPSIRLRLILLGMQRCALARDSQTAAAFNCTLQSIVPTTLTQQMLWKTSEMIWQAEFGSTADALLAASKLASLAGGCRVPQERGAAWRRAASGFLVAGQMQHSLDLCHKAADTFRMLELHSETVFCLETAANCSLHLGEYARARQLLSEVRDAAARSSQDERMRFVLFCLATAISHETGDDLCNSDGQYQYVRRAYKKQLGGARQALASGLLVWAVRRRRITEVREYSRELRDSCRLSRQSETGDLAASVCCTGLRMLGDDEQARDLVSSYLQHRTSSPCPLLPSLGRHAHELLAANLGRTNTAPNGYTARRLSR